MILSIVMIIVTTFGPFFLLFIVSKICQFCLSFVSYVGAVNQSFEVCMKSLAKVTHSVECLSVQSIVAFLLSSRALGKKKATCILMRLCSGYFACVIDNSLQDNTNRNDLTSQTIKYLGQQ